MAKFLLGVLTGFALVFLVVAVVLVAAVRMRNRPPDVADNSVLVLRLTGDIPEKPALELPILDSGRGAVTVTGVWVALRQAAADRRIKAVVLEPEGLQSGWGKIEEIRTDLETFRQSGKPVYAYLRSPGGREYYVALAADRIYLGPEDPLMLKGMRAEALYFKKTLDKLGVTVEVEHAGKYKDFGDMFTRSDMSPETREVTDSVIDDLYANLVNRIAEARHKTPGQVRALIDAGPFTATRARQADLVDSLAFEDQMWGELKNKLHAGEPSKVPIEKYIKVPAEAAGLRAGSRIALVAAEGDIVRGDPDDEGEDGELTSYGFNKLLRQVGADSSIKGVIVRIDSPGGEVTASDEIWRQMTLLSRKKPMVISMSDVAASGGYYMALTGDRIVAYPGTETGSIGVVFGKPDLRGLYEKLGVSKDAVERGRNAGIDSDYTSLTAAQRDLLKAGIDDSYHAFVEKVAEARHKPYDYIEPLAQGRVWLGSQAQPRALVDALGGLDTALALLKKKAQIPAAENVTVVMYPARRSLFDLLFQRSAEQSVVNTQLRRVFGRVPYHAWMQGGMLRLMPIWLEVR
ncbi:MAG: signal peptide peptidase SppA [Bryobacteraceae bacterium]